MLGRTKLTGIQGPFRENGSGAAVTRTAFSPAARRGGSRHPGECRAHTAAAGSGFSQALGRPEGRDADAQSRHVLSGATEPRTPLENEVGLEQVHFTFASEGTRFPPPPRTRLRCPAPHTSLWDCSQGRTPFPAHGAHGDPRVPLSAPGPSGSLVHGSVSEPSAGHPHRASAFNGPAECSQETSLKERGSLLRRSRRFETTPASPAVPSRPARLSPGVLGDRMEEEGNMAIPGPPC